MSASKSHLHNAFNFHVSSHPTRKIPTLCYIAHNTAAHYNTSDAQTIAAQHTQRLCTSLQRLDITCDTSTRQQLLDTLTKIIDTTIAESVLTLTRQRVPKSTTPANAQYIKLIIIGLQTDESNMSTNARATHKTRYTNTNKNMYIYLESIRKLGAHIQHSLRKNQLFNCQIMADPIAFKPRYWSALFEGFLLSMPRNIATKHTHHVIKSKSKSKSKSRSRTITNTKASQDPNNFYIYVITSNGKVSKVYNTLGTTIVTIRSMYMCQDLVSKPLATLTDHTRFTMPTDFIRFALSFIEKEPKLHSSIHTRIYSPVELKANGFGLIHGASGSSSHLLIIKYNPLGMSITNANANARSSTKTLPKSPKIVMIGAGITYDNSNDDASQLANATIVLSTILGYARIEANQPILAMIPLATIGAQTYSLEGKVLKSVGGKKVKIVADKVNIGELMVADCIAYSCIKWPRAHILNTNVLRALGGVDSRHGIDNKQLTCGPGNIYTEQNINKDMLHKLSHASAIIGEPLFKIPLDKFRKEFKNSLHPASVDSDETVDIYGMNEKCRNEMRSGIAFLGEFLKPDSKWIHIDIGTAIVNLDLEIDNNHSMAKMTKEDKHKYEYMYKYKYMYNIMGNCGVGVRVIMEWLTSN